MNKTSMSRRKFGRGDATVSELCFGTMNFGWTIGRETAFTLLDHFYDAGGTFIQGVHVSRDLEVLPETFQAPEAWVGDWIEHRRIDRADLQLGSRLALRFAPEGEGERRRISRSIHSILQRFKTDRIDLLILEWNRFLLPLERSLRFFEELIDEGKIDRLAFANPPLWRAMEGVALAKGLGLGSPPALQCEFSMALTGEEREEVLDLCRSYGVGLLATSALRRPGDRRVLRPSDVEVEGGIPRSASPEQMALYRVLAYEGIDSVVISTNSVPRLDELIAAASWGER